MAYLKFFSLHKTLGGKKFFKGNENSRKGRAGVTRQLEYRTHVKPTSSNDTIKQMTSTWRSKINAHNIIQRNLIRHLYIFLYCVFVIVYMSDQIALNYVVCIYFASPGASHLRNENSFFFYIATKWIKWKNYGMLQLDLLSYVRAPSVCPPDKNIFDQTNSKILQLHHRRCNRMGGTRPS